MVTGSHHPTPANGLKWMIGQKPPTPEDVAVLRQAAENGEQLSIDDVSGEASEE